MGVECHPCHMLINKKYCMYYSEISVISTTNYLYTIIIIVKKNKNILISGGN